MSRLHFWNSPAVIIAFSRVYSNCCCSCSFEPEIMKIVQSSHKMHNNNILNFQESTTILNACSDGYVLFQKIIQQLSTLRFVFLPFPFFFYSFPFSVSPSFSNSLLFIYILLLLYISKINPILKKFFDASMYKKKES